MPGNRQLRLEDDSATALACARRHRPACMVVTAVRGAALAAGIGLLAVVTPPMSVTRHPLLPPAAGLRGIPPDPKTIARLRQSFAQLRERADVLSRSFYERLFTAAPALRALFPPDLSVLQRQLVVTLEMVVANLDNPASVRRELHELGRRHLAAGIRPEHF